MDIVIYALSFVAFSVYAYLVSPLEGVVVGLATYGAGVIGWQISNIIDDALRARYAPKNGKE